jgi:hypothetical protein
MTDFNSIFPNFVNQCVQLKRFLMPVAFVMLAGGMISPIIARAQTIEWERFADQSPARVIRAISERCAKAVGEAHNEIQEQILEQRMTRRMLNRQAMSNGV